MATIFVVDDHDDSCRVMGRLLSVLGHATRCFDSGESVLDALAGRLPDAMVLDLMMPGIDGMEVLRRVKAEPRTAAVKVIIHSALSEPAVIKLARIKGAAAYWEKGTLHLGQVEDELSRLLGDG